MKNENFITITGWMVNRLRLTGNELLVYALIFGFSQDGETEFKGSLNYIAEAINVSKDNVRKILKRLVEKGFINKRDETINGVTFCRYSIIGGIDETSTPLMNHQGGGVDESSPNNIIYNNNIDNIYKPAKEKTLIKTENERKTLFRNSEIYALKTGDDYSRFEELFREPELSNIDLVYYFNVVSDWSDQKDMKRTKRGWIATIRNFIRKDMETNRVHLKNQSNQSGINVEQALQFLNDDY